jgi:hypothetical protein
LDETLPCIPIPLRENEAQVPLDLQFASQKVYDGGPYARGAIDYSRPPDPPVRPELDVWMKSRLNFGAE